MASEVLVQIVLPARGDCTFGVDVERQEAPKYLRRFGECLLKLGLVFRCVRPIATQGFYRIKWYCLFTLLAFLLWLRDAAIYL